MCGIIGIGGGNKGDLIEKELKALHHRGPDDSGIFENDNVTLGHTRLSVIDLSPSGHQPMGVPEIAVISFNGEIYNYRELKRDLMKEKCAFRGGSDTEVIIQGYIREGRNFLSKLRGMWALAIYDIKKGEIILSRDHFGIKPLYYSIFKNEIYFASEIKTLRKLIGDFTPNTEKYCQFYNLGYFIGENTCYKEVKKVLPGELIIWDLKLHSSSKESLPLQIERKNENLTFDEAVKIAEDSITDSVEKHYIADVTVSLLLSGGNDSSLLAAISRKVDKTPICYHVAIPGSIDTKYAKKIASYLGLNLIEKELTEHTMEEEYKQMEKWLDIPTSDVSVIPTALVYKSIDKESKVVLSGEGGDELFGGYLRHKVLSSLNRISFRPSSMDYLYSASNFGLNYLNPIIRRLQEKLAYFFGDLTSVYLHQSKILGFPENNAFIQKELSDFYNSHPYKNLVPANLFFDQFMYLPDSLMYKNDITSMAFSIEARVPLVDREVLKTASGIPDKFKLSRDYTDKKILKAILKKYLPEDLVNRPKKGFGFSFERFKTNFFLGDYKKAAKFHINNAENFAVSPNLRRMLSESRAELICKKFPRFAFAIITNHKIMGRH